MKVVLGTSSYHHHRQRDERSPLDAPIPALRLPAALPACGMNTAVARLRRAATIPIGFEMEWECFGSVPTLPRDGEDVTGKTVRDVLDHLMLLATNYRWKERDGVIVIRPITSWDDPQNPLNLTVPAFRQRDATVSSTIAKLLDVPTPPGRAPGDDAFDFAFEGGTRADALNALIRSRAGLGWDIGFILHQPVPNPTLTVRVYKDAWGWMDIGTPLVRLVPQH
jgi:hypothetical protein